MLEAEDYMKWDQKKRRRRGCTPHGGGGSFSVVVIVLLLYSHIIATFEELICSHSMYRILANRDILWYYITGKWFFISERKRNDRTTIFSPQQEKRIIFAKR